MFSLCRLPAGVAVRFDFPASAQPARALLLEWNQSLRAISEDLQGGFFLRKKATQLTPLRVAPTLLPLSFADGGLWGRNVPLRTALLDGPEASFPHRLRAQLLPRDSHPLFSPQAAETVDLQVTYQLRLRNPRKGAFFPVPRSRSGSHVQDLMPNGVSFPLSSRNARVQRAARSRLCVTRIEVRP